MKINLLTMHYSLSCGAVMQTYATCKVLERLGCDVTIINFKNPIELERRKSLRFWLSNGITKIKFDLFRKRYFPKRTDEIFSINYSSLPIADCYITGSDQIWNPKIVSDNLFVYMLEFLPDDVKRISYASSLGLSEWNFPKEMTDKVISCLSKFDSLSVRENSGVAICKRVFGLDAVQVLDPTLLLSDYSDLIGDVSPVDELVCFKLVHDDDFFKSVSFLKKQTNLKTVLLYTNKLNRKFDKSIMFCSPEKWLRKLASAKLVLTDSFHGLAFSLIFKKNFIVLGGSEHKITRILSLLELLGLTDRFVRDYDELSRKYDLLKRPIDYAVVDDLLKRERCKSLDYLKTSLFYK